MPQIKKFDDDYHADMRQRNKAYYYSEEGHIKTKFKYLKKKHNNDPKLLEIINDEKLSLKQRLIQAKMFSLTQRLADLSKADKIIKKVKTVNTDNSTNGDI